MEQACAAPVVRFRLGVVLQLDERNTAGAEPHAAVLTMQQVQSDDVAVEFGRAVQVPHPQPDRADMQRSAAGEGGRRRRSGGIHGILGGAEPLLRNGLVPSRLGLR